jgi:hypothetical protein
MDGSAIPRPATVATHSDGPCARPRARAGTLGIGITPLASRAAISTAKAPITIWTLGKVKCADPRRPGRNAKMTTRPTVAPIAKPPLRNASSCSAGLGLFSISDVIPMRKRFHADGDGHNQDGDPHTA